MADAVFRGTREELARLLQTIPGILAGTQPDQLGIAQAVQYRAGAVALACIQNSFIVKSNGGTDESGTKWAPLKPETIAYHRRHPGLAQIRKRAAQKGRSSRPLLTDAQDSHWRRVFARVLAARLRAGDGEQEAKAVAGGAAWNAVKAVGGRTIIGEYGNRPVSIGRDTGLLFASLSPGVSGPSGNPDQIFEVKPGEVIVGSKRPYAAAFHAKRPLWPSQGLPSQWWAAITKAVAEGLAEALAVLIGRGITR